MMLQNKIAVIYGAGGAIGGAVARAFAREGAQVFLTGLRRAPLEEIAGEINLAGGSAAVAQVDSLDEKAMDQHLQQVVEQTGRIDISFNAAGIHDARSLGVPLVELDAALFSQPIADYTRSFFLTARLATYRKAAALTERAGCGRSNCCTA